jgi:hypothetical protein
MKKFIYILLFALAPFCVKAQQAPTQISNPYWFLKWIKVNDSARIARIFMKDTLVIINGTDTLANKRYVRTLASASKFTFDLPINLSSGKSLGKYTNGQTAHFVNLTVPQIFTDIATETIHPTYNLPTAGISSSQPQGNYEIGTVFSAANSNQVVLSSSFTQNQGGSLTGTTYKQDGVTVSSTVPTFTLGSSTVFQVQKTYAVGVCIANNLGVIDCTVGAGNAPNPAPVAAGTATSGTITLTGSPMVYWGRTATTSPSSGTIIGHTGGNQQLGPGHNLTVTITASGTNYAYYAYAATEPDLTAITINSLPALSTFTKYIISVTNFWGFTQNYKVYISNNPFTQDVTPTFQ